MVLTPHSLNVFMYIIIRIITIDHLIYSLRLTEQRLNFFIHFVYRFCSFSLHIRVGFFKFYFVAWPVPHAHSNENREKNVFRFCRPKMQTSPGKSMVCGQSGVFFAVGDWISIVLIWMNMKWLCVVKTASWRREKTRAHDGIAICMANDEDDDFGDSDGDVWNERKIYRHTTRQRLEFSCVRFESTMSYNWLYCREFRMPVTYCARCANALHVST